jgi:hypothetical protein
MIGAMNGEITSAIGKARLHNDVFAPKVPRRPSRPWGSRGRVSYGPKLSPSLVIARPTTSAAQSHRSAHAVIETRTDCFAALAMTRFLCRCFGGLADGLSCPWVYRRYMTYCELEAKHSH